LSTQTGETGQELLRLFLNAEDDEQANQLLERLFCEQADPVIKNVLRRKMGVHLDDVRRLDRMAGGGGAETAGNAFSPPKRSVELDAEDVHATCVLSLLEHLWSLRGSTTDAPIGDFRAYVARIALNAFAQQMRRRYPERHRLRRKLWYLAEGRTPVKGFAWWPGQNPSEQICGFRAWQGRPIELTDNYRRWQRDPWEFQQAAAEPRDPRRVAFPELVAEVLNWVGGPMEVDDLAGGLMEILGICEVEVIAADEYG
jgi:DNA-directed RNA polymerase specialized sigma24 family protein